MRFTVVGLPVAQGSTKAFVIAGRARVTHSNVRDLTSWRAEVATRAMAEHAGAPPFDGPLELICEFRFPMPKSRPKYIRRLQRVWRSSTPDLDKLIRSVGDSLTAAAVITDDSRIVRVAASKVDVHELWTGADITIRQLDPMEVPT